MDKLIKPYFTGEYYRPSDVVKIVNHAQANFYLSRKVPLLDLYCSRGYTVYVFHKKSSYESYRIWNEQRPGEKKNEETASES